MSEHDPFNEPETAHPRAREIMVESIFWDCADEAAPFGSDEGAEAYYEWRSWREENQSAPLIDCISWILSGDLDGYNETLCTDQQIVHDVTNPDDAFMADSWDIFTLDTTIIATVLGQLMDEGKIDSAAKRYANIAITRQRHSSVGHYDIETLAAIQRAVNAG